MGRKDAQTPGKNIMAKRVDFLNGSRMGTLSSNLGINVIVSLFYRLTPFWLVTVELYL